MKIQLFVLLAFCTNLILSQKIIVQYSVKPIENQGLDKLYADLSENYQSTLLDFNFNLYADKNNSYFELDSKNITSETNNLEVAKLKVEYMGAVYQQSKSIYIDYSESIYGDFIVKKEKDSIWELTNDSKKINNFLCFKAIKKIQYTNGFKLPDGSLKIFEKNIIAWYSPELPFSHGPLGYGGLPGMILELQTKNAVFGATKINNVSNFEYKPLNQNKIISDEIFSKKLKEFNDFRKNK